MKKIKLNDLLDKCTEIVLDCQAIDDKGTQKKLLLLTKIVPALQDSSKITTITSYCIEYSTNYNSNSRLHINDISLILDIYNFIGNV